MALSSTLPADVAVEEILSVPALHAEAKSVAPMLREAAKGCGERGVMDEMARLLLHFRDVTEQAKSKTFWRDYVEQLEMIPREALAKAVSDYMGREDAEFFPKPGPLRALALKRAEPIFRASNRAARAANSLPRRVIERAPVEERRAVVEALRIKPVPREKGE